MSGFCGPGDRVMCIGRALCRVIWARDPWRRDQADRGQCCACIAVDQSAMTTLRSLFIDAHCDCFGLRPGQGRTGTGTIDRPFVAATGWSSRTTQLPRRSRWISAGLLGLVRAQRLAPVEVGAGGRSAQRGCGAGRGRGSCPFPARADPAGALSFKGQLLREACLFDSCQSNPEMFFRLLLPVYST